jgi:hypothetical protein
VYDEVVRSLHAALLPGTRHNHHTTDRMMLVGKRVH